MTYTADQRLLQAEFGSTALADRLGLVMSDRLQPDHVAFIESSDLFFLSTVDDAGFPSVSHKGGPVGFVRAIDEHTIAYPEYDGNGMFWSTGNVASTGKVGFLFIDLVTPRRLRVHATATVSSEDPLLADHPGATLIVRATVREVFVNCARYIHKHQRVESSPYVPAADGSQPLPAWKRIDLVQDVLDDDSRAATEAAGGPITAEEYAARVADGTS